MSTSWGVTPDGLPLYRQAELLGLFGGKDTLRHTLAANGVVPIGQGRRKWSTDEPLCDGLLRAPLFYGEEAEINNAP